jgi:hypothetical protein
VTSWEKSANGISPVEERIPAPNTFKAPASSIRPNSIENQLKRLRYSR